MKKFAFLGAGSYVFTRNLIRDILTYPAFEDCEIALMDIDPERLGYALRCAEKLIASKKSRARVYATQDRRQALEGADGVISAIRVGGFEVWRRDIEIPEAHGVDICVGDTRGPSAIFRALRTIPTMLDICRDIEELCPEAVFLNYTNPMAMLCRAMQQQSRANVTGLCHSIRDTAAMLARFIGAPKEEITYLCAGINHQAWFLEYRWNGRDAYPLLRQAMEKPDIYNEEIVRNQLFRHLGYYVTESSGHSSEYVPWFRKRPELVEQYCLKATCGNPGVHAMSIAAYHSRQATWRQEFEEWVDSPTNLQRGDEYAAGIFNALFGDGEMYEFNGNVRNFGLIDNLPAGCCVEVPVIASPAGCRAVHVGALPPQLALLTGINAQCEELAVEGALTGDPQKIYQACYFDPLTAAALSLDEIQAMVREMFEANREYLPTFKHYI